MIYALLALLLLAAIALLLVPVMKDSALPRAQRQRFAAAVSIFFLLGGPGLYALLGAPKLVPVIAEHNAHMQKLHKDMQAQLDAAEANPRNLDAWVELGRIYMEAGQYKNAAHAFRQAVILSQGHPMVILAYATAMIYDDDGKISDDAKKALDMVLLQQPDNAEARYFLVLRMLQDGQTKQAMKAMKELYRSLPENSPLKGTIDKQIGRK